MVRLIFWWTVLTLPTTNRISTEAISITIRSIFFATTFCRRTTRFSSFSTNTTLERRIHDYLKYGKRMGVSNRRGWRRDWRLRWWGETTMTGTGCTQPWFHRKIRWFVRREGMMSRFCRTTRCATTSSRLTTTSDSRCGENTTRFTTIFGRLERRRSSSSFSPGATRSASKRMAIRTTSLVGRLKRIWSISKSTFAWWTRNRVPGVV